MLQQRSKSVGPWERFSGYFKITKEKRSTAKLTTLACLKLAQQEVTRYKHFGLLCYDICDKENKFQNIDTRKRGILNSIQIAIIQTFSLRASFLAMFCSSFNSSMKMSWQILMTREKK